MKRPFILSILFVQITMVCAQNEAYVEVSGMRPEAGQTIRGYVYLDSIARPNCIVMEKNAQGKAVNATSTDANGSFSLKIVNPDDLIHVSACAYSPKQKKTINYKAKVKHAGMGFMGYDDFKHEINGSDFKIWLNDGVDYFESYSRRRYSIDDKDFLRNRQTPTQRPIYPINLLSSERYDEYLEQHNLTERAKASVILPRRKEIELLLSVSAQDVTSSGIIPEAGEPVTGFVMDNAGPMFPVLITERDSKNNIVSQTETLPNGEFTLKVADPKNHFCILIEGYHEIRHRYDGNRFLIFMQEGYFTRPGGKDLPIPVDDLDEEPEGKIVINLEEAYPESFFRTQTNITNNVPKSVIKPESGDMIRGRVYVKNIQTGGCIVAERDNRGKLINVTATDGAGDFVLYLVNPRNKIWIYHSDYVPFNNAPIGFNFTVNLKDTIASKKGGKVTPWARVLRTEKRTVIASGRKPEYGGDWIQGAVIDANGPIRKAVIAEIDLNGTVISETKTYRDGEFLFYLTSPDNRLRVTHDGYNDIITKIEGTRLVFLPQAKK